MGALLGPALTPAEGVGTPLLTITGVQGRWIVHGPDRRRGPFSDAADVAHVLLWYAGQGLMTGTDVATHAACVVRDGNGLLIVGASGAGKSTVTAALVATGWHLLSDEAVVVAPDAWGHGFQRPLVLRDGGVDALRTDGLIGDAVTSGVVPVEVLGGARVDTAPIKGVVILGEDDSPDLTTQSPGVTLVALAAGCPALARGHRPALERLVEVVTSAPAVVVPRARPATLAMAITNWFDDTLRDPDVAPGTISEPAGEPGPPTGRRRPRPVAGLRTVRFPDEIVLVRSDGGVAHLHGSALAAWERAIMGPQTATTGCPPADGQDVVAALVAEGFAVLV